LPEGLAVQDWGLTYDELEPDYWRAEQMLGVSGKAGNLRGQVVEGGNPFEGPRRQEYPTPPTKKSHKMVVYERAARNLGLHPFPRPCVTLSESYTNPDGISRAGCSYCNYCMSYGCMIAAKAQPTNTLMPLLEGKSSFTLRNHCWARRIVHGDGQAHGVIYMDEKGEEILQPAGIVIVGAFTTCTARLLLLSKVGQLFDPETGKGSLGKNLTHTGPGGSADQQLVFKEKLNSFMGSGGMGTLIADYDADHGFDPAKGFLRGGVFSMSGTRGVLPIESFGAVPAGEVSRTWGSDWKKAAVLYHDRIVRPGGITGEHVAYRQNYMDLDPAYTDKWGDPLLRFTLDFTEHEIRQQEFGTSIANRLVREMAQVSGGRLVPVKPRFERRYSAMRYQSTHIQGGVIIGASPETSVLNPWLQHWDLPNLWVLGASAFPQNAAGHPTLTVLALAFRAADALIGRYLKNPGALA
jgi:gluconate 2-dehydrogenase alpha chain